MAEESETKGFKVRDRRIFSSDEGSTAAFREELHAEQKQKEKEEQEERPASKGSNKAGTNQIPLPEATFSNFLTLFFFQQTLVFLGELPQPETGRVEKNLPMAKYLIDTLAILKEKTRGNLTPDEKNQLETFLAELRMRYVKAV
jgi:hypothetical protein